jgi:phage-related protein
MLMEFSILFYEDESGRAPVQEFLDELKHQQPNLYALVLAGLVKLRDRQNHREPLSRHVEGSLFELRVGRKNIARVIYFFRQGRRIVLLHGFVKKTQKLPRREIELALRRLADHVRRYPNE